MQIGYCPSHNIASNYIIISGHQTKTALSENITILITTINSNPTLQIDFTNTNGGDNARKLLAFVNRLRTIVYLPEVPMEIEMDTTSDNLLAQKEQKNENDKQIKRDTQLALQLANGDTQQPMKLDTEEDDEPQAPQPPGGLFQKLISWWNGGNKDV